MYKVVAYSWCNMLTFSDQLYQLVARSSLLMAPMIAYDRISVSRQLISSIHFQVYGFITYIAENTAVNNYILSWWYIKTFSKKENNSVQYSSPLYSLVQYFSPVVQSSEWIHPSYIMHKSVCLYCNLYSLLKIYNDVCVSYGV